MCHILHTRKKIHALGSKLGQWIDIKMTWTPIDADEDQSAILISGIWIKSFNILQQYLYQYSAIGTSLWIHGDAGRQIDFILVPKLNKCSMVICNPFIIHLEVIVFLFITWKHGMGSPATLELYIRVLDELDLLWAVPRHETPFPVMVHARW